MSRYIRKWHEYLFKYNLVHSKIAQKVFCEKEMIIENSDLEEINKSSEIVWNILDKIYKGYNKEFKEVLNYVPEFPLRDEILNISRSVETPFWSRYDTFFSKDGVFFAEFNYDKPCAQREALVMEKVKFNKNTNIGFKREFIDSLINKSSNGKGLAILCNDQYEELHLANLFRNLLKGYNVNLIIAKKNNFKVEGEKLYCFNNEIDTIVRLYPTEELYKVNDIEKILKLFDQKKINIINDPRVIILQSKEVFIYLRKLIEEDNVLTEEEKNIIKLVIPKTKVLEKDDLEKIKNDPNGIIIKPVLGRYSRNVFVPQFNTKEEREEIYKYISKEILKNKYLFQEYKQMLGQYIPHYDGNKIDLKYGYGNYGVFIINGKIQGYGSRWCTTPITNEWLSWSTPLKKYSSTVNYYPQKIDLSKLNKKAIFNYQFTGMYTGDRTYLDNRVLTISKEKSEELVDATNILCSIFLKVKNIINNNIELFKEFLDIDVLLPFLENDLSKSLGCIGRLDWIIDYNGNLKLIEINSETPAGLNEAINIEKLYLEQLDNEELKSLNNNMVKSIVNEIKRVISDYSKVKPIKRVGILGCVYYEDWYNNNALFKIFKENIKDIEFIQGNIYDLRIVNGKAYIYGKELDAIYRYFPLDWFVKENMIDIKEGLNENYFFINSSNTIITQSKGFLVIIYELLKQGFFTNYEAEVIKKYIPFTSFDLENFCGKDYIYKPILGREGQGVEFSYNIQNNPKDIGVFQEVVESQKVRGIVKNSFGDIPEELYPVIGTYIVNDKFAGVYTRVGEAVTNKDCQYAPLLVKL